MKKAAEFSLYAPFENRWITRTMYAGTPLLLTFWASWCPEAQEDLQKKETLFSTMKEKRIQMLTINVTGRERHPEAGVEFATVNGFNIPLVLDEGIETYERYQCQGVPTTVLITKDGEIAGQFGDDAAFSDILFQISKFLV